MPCAISTCSIPWKHCRVCALLHLSHNPIEKMHTGCVIQGLFASVHVFTLFQWILLSFTSIDSPQATARQISGPRESGIVMARTNTTTVGCSTTQVRKLIQLFSFTYSVIFICSFLLVWPCSKAKSQQTVFSSFGSEEELPRPGEKHLSKPLHVA